MKEVTEYYEVYKRKQINLKNMIDFKFSGIKQTESVNLEEELTEFLDINYRINFLECIKDLRSIFIDYDEKYLELKLEDLTTQESIIIHLKNKEVLRVFIELITDEKIKAFLEYKKETGFNIMINNAHELSEKILLMTQRINEMMIDISKIVE